MTTRYYHKKFDVKKRAREDDDECVASSPLTWDTSATTLGDDNGLDLAARIPALPQQISKFNYPYSLSSNKVYNNKKRLAIEIIDIADSDEGIVTTSTPKRPRRRRKTDSRSEGYFSSDGGELSVKIKKELIDLKPTIIETHSDTIERICRFRSNMVRKFPKKERNPKEQERRDKNTYACRRSRRAKKIEQLVIEETYKECRTNYMALREHSVRGESYLKELYRLLVPFKNVYIVN